MCATGGVCWWHLRPTAGLRCLVWPRCIERSSAAWRPRFSKHCTNCCTTAIDWRRRQMAHITELETSIYTVPTDRPEADGTMRWDSTTLLLIEVVADSGQRGLG